MSSTGTVLYISSVRQNAALCGNELNSLGHIMEVSDTHVFPGFLTPVLTTFFQSHQLLFSRASAAVRGENMLERKFASTGDRTQNHQVMSLTRSPLSQQGRAT